MKRSAMELFYLVYLSSRGLVHGTLDKWALVVLQRYRGTDALSISKKNFKANNNVCFQMSSAFHSLDAGT